MVTNEVVIKRRLFLAKAPKAIILEKQNVLLFFLCRTVKTLGAILKLFG